MSIVHLLHGLPGSGKSTFAKKIESDCGAVVLSHDIWMVDLYGTNPPIDQFPIYHDRVLGVIWRVAQEFIKRDVDVVLDHGFWTRRSRDEARMMVERIGATPRLYRMVCPDSVADTRVLERVQRDEGKVLKIDEHALQVFRSRYEPLQLDENCISILTTA